MENFSVVVVTAAPAGHAAEAGGAFVKIDGREALLRSVELFLNRDPVKQIQVVILPDDLEEAKRKYGPHLSFSGVKLTSGGPTWADQLKAAAPKIAPDATHVVIHDAARPIVPYTDIDALLESAGKQESLVLVAPVRGELLQVEGTEPVRAWPPDEFVQVLTPQVFTRARFDQFVSAGENPAERATLLKGSPLNMRLRGSGDASLAKAMMNLLPKPKLKPPSSPFEEAQW